MLCRGLKCNFLPGLPSSSLRWSAKPVFDQLSYWHALLLRLHAQRHTEFKFREGVLSNTRYELSLIHFLIKHLRKTFRKGDQPGSEGSRQGGSEEGQCPCPHCTVEDAEGPTHGDTASWLPSITGP